MVSIVIVSHSVKLAEGVRDLAQQVVQGEIGLALAGGIEDPEIPLGTDAFKVLEAIEAVYSEDGVLILMDLGSALLSAETALEFLPPERRKNVYLCEAPLVEGAVAAAVQASIGGSIKDVMAEARGALQGKVEQLGLEGTRPITETAAVVGKQEDLALHIEVTNRLGLHLRPAAMFVRTANRYQAEISVSKEGKQASARSINQLATLDVRQGDFILISAAGLDAAEALMAFQALANDNFGDGDDAYVSSSPSPLLFKVEAGETIQGIAASPGVVIGPVIRYRKQWPAIIIDEVDNPEAEWGRLRGALAEAAKELQATVQATGRLVGAGEAGIFQAQLLFLEDPALIDVAKARIFERKMNAEAAWQKVIEEMASVYQSLEDNFLRARASDLLDVGQRVLQHLVGVDALKITAQSFAPHEPSILVVADLTPSEIVTMDPADVLGICTGLGGATSHSVILAKALGIPTIVGLGANIEKLAEGRTVAMDGAVGQVWLDPDAKLLAKLEKKQAVWMAEKSQAVKERKEAAITQDGHRIEIAANIGRPEDAITALAYGAEGVGLFRTEFLFLDRSTAPSEDEQYDAYRQVIQSMGNRPVIFRTLDVGGDKALPYLNPEAEDNPFLGWRGIRICLDRPAFFKTQLRAILRAGAGFNVKIMFPMISSLEELAGAKELLRQARVELSESGVPHEEQMEVGIMIEVPAAVTMADQLAAEVDFFSIGTNDLSQYVMAADRGNPKVIGLADDLQPAVLRMVAQTIQAGHAAGIWVGSCGELAGNPLTTSVLIGLGLDELSMNPLAIPMVKKGIRNLELKQARETAETALALSSAVQIQAFLSGERPVRK